MKYLLVIACCILLFSNCFDASNDKNGEKDSFYKEYLEKGETIAASTFSVLGGNLQAALKSGGVSNAISYCNVAASPLVDSLMQVHNAKIKRTSLKIRNLKNQPTEKELIQLKNYQRRFEAGSSLKPVVQKVGNNVVFYAPIHMMPLCENCHGKKEGQLKLDDYALIKELYPLDKAINFNSGDLRGMWSITFTEK